ncbi:MAG: hypothetical protein ACTSX4_11615 [Candidatus Helarchaeota archaeon]
MKHLNWRISLGIILITASIVIYLVHYLIFRDIDHILIFLIGDVAFLPLEVLIVTLLLDEFLKVREKKLMLSKLNIVIGAFFSEMGTELLEFFSNIDPDSERIRREMLIDENWDLENFKNIQVKLSNFSCTVDCNNQKLAELSVFLLKKKDFLLALLENPNLLEHESFTNLLWSVFHLMDEFRYKEHLKCSELGAENYFDHITSDM